MHTQHSKIKSKEKPTTMSSVILFQETQEEEVERTEIPYPTLSVTPPLAHLEAIPLTPPRLTLPPPRLLVKPKPPRLVRGFNNQELEHIHKVLRVWLQHNDPEYEKRGDDITDLWYQRTCPEELDWWDLGAKTGPYDYDVNTLDEFISTLSLTEQEYYRDVDYETPKFKFSRKQAEMIYDTMMENTRILYEYDTVSQLFSR